MKKPGSVALVSAGYPPYRSAGIDVQTCDLAHGLSREGVEVTVFCGGSDVPKLTRENDKLKIFRLPMSTVPPQVLWFQLENLGILTRSLESFDLVHTQHSSGSIYGLVKKEARKPWIVSFHDHQLRRLSMLLELSPWNLSPKDIAYYSAGYLMFEVLTRLELRADHYIVCGQSGFADYVNFSKMDQAKATVIPNGIDLEKIRSILRAKNECWDSSEEDEFVIFTCGRLYASKGIQYLIRAMPNVTKRIKNVKLKIFGSGPLYPYFRELIHSLNLQSVVTLAGHVPYDRLICEMNKSDLAVFPSLVEVGASLAVMEAMACRKAIVAFKYPFSAEVIHHLKTGWHVPPKDLEALANAICILLEDESLRKRLGENAYQNIVENHDTRNVVKKYIEVYSEALYAND